VIFAVTGACGSVSITQRPAHDGSGAACSGEPCLDRLPWITWPPLIASRRAVKAGQEWSYVDVFIRVTHAAGASC